MPDERSIELEVEVPGRPETVWRTVATGPGISSWYVPHTVEERAGGVGTASFGPEPEMQVSGRVVVWEPPRRVVFDGGEGVDGLAFEWTVEPRGDDTCVVRLVNSGFGSGPEQDALREGMIEGWRLFMFNLRLHREHFAGRTATAVIPTALWAGPREAAWEALLGGLGLPPDPAVGDRIEVAATDTPELAGTVVDVDPRWVALVLDRPAPGTAFLAVEGDASTSPCRSGHTSTAPTAPPQPPATTRAGANGSPSAPPPDRYCTLGRTSAGEDLADPLMRQAEEPSDVPHRQSVRT